MKRSASELGLIQPWSCLLIKIYICYLRGFLLTMHLFINNNKTQTMIPGDTNQDPDLLVNGFPIEVKD